MGLQIILIVLFHFAGDAYEPRDSRIIYLYWKYIRSSGVDMFLLLSGIGLYFSWKKRPEIKPFYIRRFTRVLISYFIIAVPAWFWFDIIHLQLGWVRFFEDLFFVTFFTDGTRRFWYILMALICYLIFPRVYDLIETAVDQNSARMRILLLCVTSTVFVVLLNLFYNEMYKFTAIAINRIPAFLIGVLLGKAVYEKKQTPRWHIWLMAAVAVVIAWPLQMVTASVPGVFSLAFLNYSLSLIFIMILAYLAERKNVLLSRVHNLAVKILSWFGVYTLELYLLHVAIRRVMNYLGHPSWRLSNQAIIIISSIILSVIVNKIAGCIQKRIVSGMNGAKSEGV